MGYSAINSLANMEYMLYGGASNLNGNCPSYSNGYMATNYANYNPAFIGGYGYGYNPAMNGYYNPSVFVNPQTAAATATAATAGLGAAAGTTVAGISEQDWKVLADYASKVNEAGETFGGALFSGLTFAAFENPQNVKHPWNAIQGMKNADAIFNLNKELWKTQPELMQNAYSQAQAAYRRLEPKNFFSGMFAKQVTGKDADAVKKMLEDLRIAVEKGNKNQIIELTQKLKDARGMDGYLIPGKNYSVAERLANKAEASAKSIEKAKEALKAGESWFTGAKFMKEAKGWFFFEALIEGATKVLPTYIEGGADSGHKQLVQSGAKAAASAAGWAAGRLAGGWIGTKAGAAIGTAICPGVGTAVGAVIGFAGGCVGSWLATKGVKAAINKIWGKEESEKLAEAKMTGTQEGRAQLIQLAYEKALKGEAPKEVINSLRNVA